MFYNHPYFYQKYIRILGEPDAALSFNIDPLTWIDIGSPALLGSHTYNSTSGLYQVQAAGADMWTNHDEFYFGYEQLDGDFEIYSYFSNLVGSYQWSRAGITFRNNLNDNSAHISFIATEEHHIDLQYRSTNNGNTANWNGVITGDPTPIWLKLTRQSDTFTAYTGANGTDWISVKSTGLSLNSNLYGGIFVCAVNTGQYTSATISNYTSTPLSTGGGGEAGGGAQDFSYNPPIQYWVATNGSDSNPGTQGSPFLTISKARDQLRTDTGRTSSGGNPAGNWSGALITFKDGSYNITGGNTFLLDDRDGGTQSFPIQYRGESGSNIVIAGTYPVNSGSWQIVNNSTDSTAYALLPTASQGSVYRLNVNGLGVNLGTLEDYKTFPNRAFGTDKTLRLVITGGIVKMSRYPNWPDDNPSNWLIVTNSTSMSQGQGGINRYMDVASSVPAGWGLGMDIPANQKIFVQGSLTFPYYFDWHEISGIATQGGGSRMYLQRWTSSSNFGEGGYDAVTEQFLCFRNGLSFMTTGSCVWNKVDRGGSINNYLYYWSPNGQAPTGSSILTESGFIKMGIRGNSSKGVNYVAFNNLKLEGGRDIGIQGFYCSGITFRECHFRNYGHTSLLMENSNKVEILGGKAYYGAREECFLLHGGNRQNLQNSQNLISGTEFYDIGYDCKTPIDSAISTSPFKSQTDSDAACGLTINNVNMHDIRDGCVVLEPAFCVIKNSNFRRFCTIVGDAGGLSNGFNFTSVGCLISGSTFQNMSRLAGLHNQSYGALNAIYLDLLGSWSVVDNTFLNCDQAILAGGGLKHKFHRNKFSGCSNGHFQAAIVFGSRQSHVDDPGDVPGNVLNDVYAAVNTTISPWSTSYGYVKEYRSAGTYYSLRGYQQDPFITDNLSNGRLLAMNIASDFYQTQLGIQVGVNSGQLQYPTGNDFSITLVSGGGNTALSAMMRDYT